MNGDGAKLRQIAEFLDAVDERAGRPGSGVMQADLRRIANDLDQPEPAVWLAVDEQSVHLPDVEYVSTGEVVTLGLSSGRIVVLEVDGDEATELVAEIHRSRS